jgi:protein-ribulosamine 3-kinase
MTLDGSLLKSIGLGLSNTLDRPVEVQWVRSLSGGDINHAALINGGNTNWFLKYHQNSPEGMFAAEMLALTEIAESGAIKVPSPIADGNDGHTAWLVLEHLELTSRGSASDLGEQLAAMHELTFERYGWVQNNYIGSTPQFNSPCDNWARFWRDSRLKPQLDMAKAAGFGADLLDIGERLLESMDQLMDGHQPAASLLHGDLWAGNKAFTRQEQAVIFDPASYHGDRETDIAMTELFGGFEPDFYAAYGARLPLPDGYRLRRDLYNLYHMLNHLNLFGSGYLSRCINIIDRLMAQIRG